MRQALFIEKWMPATTNQIYHGHWTKRRKLKADDQQTVAAYARLYDLRPASGRRRVSLHVVVPRGKRRPDQDAFFKSLLDAPTSAKVLVDDSPKHCQLGEVSFSRADESDGWGSLILIEDIG